MATQDELLKASPDDYWDNIVDVIESAGRYGTHAMLLNHEAAHLLAWAKIARDQAKAERPAGTIEVWDKGTMI